MKYPTPVFLRYAQEIYVIKRIVETIQSFENLSHNAQLDMQGRCLGKKYVVFKSPANLSLEICLVLLFLARFCVG